ARADEGVVGELQRLAERVEAGGAGVHERGDGLARGLGGKDVLERVVVGAAEVAHRLSSRAAVARDGVGLDELERVPEVRIAVDVRDRVGDVGGRRAHRSLLSSPRRGHDRCAAAPELGAWSVRAYARTPSDPAGRAIMRRAVARAVMDTGYATRPAAPGRLTRGGGRARPTSRARPRRTPARRPPAARRRPRARCAPAAGAGSGAG